MQLGYSKKAQRRLNSGVTNKFEGYTIIDHYKYLETTVDYRLQMNEHLVTLKKKTE